MTYSRLLTFTADDQQQFGAIDDAGAIVSLSAEFSEWQTLRDVIAAGALGKVLAAAKGRSATHHADKVRFDIPVPNPERIICVGVNFPDRNAEYKDGQAEQLKPSLFPRFASSFVGHNVPLNRPPESEQLDYEGEVVLVIGKGGRRIPTETALDHVAALTLCNEGSIRDWIRHAKFNVTQGKNFDGTGAIGPWLVPFTGEDQIKDIELSTTVNGEVRQQDRSSRMIFNYRFLINYISTFTTLVPGDMIVTGTPTGAGARFDPPIWLKPGDVVEVRADGIGTLRNGVRDEVIS